MDARGTCDGRHRARKSCPDPECYLKDPHPPTTGEIADAAALEEHETTAWDEKGIPVRCDGPDACRYPDHPLPHGHPGHGFPVCSGCGQVLSHEGRCTSCGSDNGPWPPWHPEDHGVQGNTSEEHAALAAEPQPGDPEWWAFARDNPGRAKEIVRDNARASVAEMDAIHARATIERLAEEPSEFGPGIYRWICSRPGGYQRTVTAHDLPPAPEGWRWSSAQCTAVGGRGALQVAAAVVDSSEGANAATGPQALQLEITGRTGYCTSLDVLLFARPL